MSLEEINKTIANLLEKSDTFKSVEDILARAKLVKRNVERYGHKDWYDWSVNNWGTKWNAYSYNSYYEGGDTIIFQTAWSAPEPIIELLSQKYPDVEFSHSWADENIGYNVGKSVYKNGEVISSNIPAEGSVDAFEMTEDITGVSLEDRKFYKTQDGKSYKYCEYIEGKKRRSSTFYGVVSALYKESGQIVAEWTHKVESDIKQENRYFDLEDRKIYLRWFKNIVTAFKFVEKQNNRNIRQVAEA
jgi:hypothetical protein